MSNINIRNYEYFEQNPRLEVCHDRDKQSLKIQARAVEPGWSSVGRWHGLCIYAQDSVVEDVSEADNVLYSVTALLQLTE